MSPPFPPEKNITFHCALFYCLSCVRKGPKFSEFAALHTTAAASAFATQRSTPGWTTRPLMGRWTQYDEDDYRLPEGIKRIGYDADTGCYYFRDREGLVYKGSEGSEFGELTQVAELPIPVSAEGGSDNDVEADPARADGYRPLAVDEHGSRHVLRGGAYRTLFPFFLIIAVVLLLVWRLAFSPTVITPAPCPSTTIPYVVQPNDTCWEIARRHNSTLDKFRIVNPKIVCNDLHPGDRVCVPDEKSSISRVF